MNHQDTLPDFDPTPRVPAFDFRDLPPSRQLTYQLLDWENYTYLYHLFKDDLNPFVDERFKTLWALRQYVAYQLEHALYAPHRGGCDWFFLQDDQYAGVLHLYDLTQEQTRGKHQHCTIGFATAAPFRQQGFTREAIEHLLTYLFDSFRMQQVLSYTRQENLPAIGLLERLGFENGDDVYTCEKYPAKYRYFLMQKERFKVE